MMTQPDQHQQPDKCPARQVIEQLDAREDGFEPVRQAILGESLKSAPFDGWTSPMMARSAQLTKIPDANRDLAFPGGVIDLLDYWTEQTDRHMLEAMTTEAFKSLKIREKVTLAVRSRLEHLTPNHESARRAAATIALPQYAPRGIELTWRIADRIWRGLGDSSTDYNYYSKRTILSGVWTTTFAKWLSDDSEGKLPTWDFLDDRIANVMSIEKVKADWRKREVDPIKMMSESLLPALAKLRYPSSR